MSIENLDPVGVAVGEVVGLDGMLSFSTGETIEKGTMLGLSALSAESFSGTPTGTGDRATTLTAMSGRSMQVGTYTLTYGDVTGGAGPATMQAPDGQEETITVTADGTQTFPLLGVEVEIDASGTAYDDGDTIAFAVTGASSPSFVPFSPTGSNGAQQIAAVLPGDVTRETPGDEPVRPYVGGYVRRESLVIHEDGNGDNITQSQITQMRIYGLYAIKAADLGVYDNPQ